MSKKELLAQLADHVNQIHQLVRTAALEGDLETLHLLSINMTQCLLDVRVSMHVQYAE